MPVPDQIASWATRLAESGRVPDRLIRIGMRRVIAARLRRERGTDRSPFWVEAARGPVAIAQDLANEQHYEVPPSFFELVLGPRLKYSCCWWDDASGLESAEEAMLRLTVARSGIEDGHSVLDLGCGWGSLTLWVAQRCPSSRVVAVSNSSTQRRFVEDRAARAGLGNVTVVTADIGHFDPGRRFDRIVSVEMLEHVRNHPELFRRMRRWIEDDGAIFTHVFAHRDHAYPYEGGGPASWVAERFFTGGVMPSRSLLPRSAAQWFELDADWWIDGTHYQRTLEAWLTRLDTQQDAVRECLTPVYDDVGRWLQRWRMFFMACAELFGFRSGSEWGVAHHRLLPRPGAPREGP